MSKFQKGDKVRCISNDGGAANAEAMTVGKVYTLASDQAGPVVHFMGDLGRPYSAYASRFELVTEPTFKVGDKVRCVDDRGQPRLSDQVVEGAIYTIVHVTTTDSPDSPYYVLRNASGHVLNGDRKHARFVPVKAAPTLPSAGNTLEREVPHIVILDGASEVGLLMLQPATRPHIHPTKAAAEAEARRLAKLNPGKRFIVFAAVSQTTQPPANFPPVVTKGF